MSTQDNTGSTLQKWPASGQPDRLATSEKSPSRSQANSKTNQAYWAKHVFRLASRNGGESPHYSVRIGHLKRRERFPLATSDKEAAAAKAVQIFRFLSKHGWDKTMEKYKPQALDVAKETVGDLIAASERLSTARPQSKDTYSKAFRRIVASVAGIGDGRKFDGIGDGNADWKTKVDAVKLATITPGKIVAWKNAYLEEVGGNPIRKRQATVTVNSLIRNAKALFSRKFLKMLRDEITLPDPLPFEDVTMEKRPSQRYRSKIDAAKILADARAMFAENDPESYKVMVLTLICGLRVSEVDHLLWDAFDFDAKVLNVENSEYHELKSEDSAGEIDLNDETLALFRGYLARATGEFVIESANRPRMASERSRSYRCEAAFKQVREWLREQGVTGTKPLHTMRKEIGTIIAAEHGIFEASRYLRHSDIRITAEIYADKKKKVTPSLAPGLLRTAENVIAASMATGTEAAAEPQRKGKRA